MDDASLRQFLLRLAGPARDKAKLARLLAVSESTASGWLYLSDQGRFGLDTSVRGDQNKAAKALLVAALDAVESGKVEESGVEAFVRGLKPEEAGPAERQPLNPESDDEQRAQFKRGLEYATRQLNSGASLERVIGALEAVLEMAKGESMKN